MDINPRSVRNDRLWQCQSKLKSRADPDFTALGNAFKSATKVTLSSLNVDGNVNKVLQKVQSGHKLVYHYTYTGHCGTLAN